MRRYLGTQIDLVNGSELLRRLRELSTSPK